MKAGCLSIFILALLVSCKKEPEVQVIPQVINQDTVPVPVKQDSLTKNDTASNRVIADFLKRQAEVKATLPTLKPEQANNLYENMLIQNGKTITELDRLERVVLDNFYSYYTYSEDKLMPPPDVVKKKEKKLTDAGLQFWIIGEGYVEITTLPDFYLNIFKDYVTPDYKKYLEITANEDKDLYTADAGIIIPLKDLANRIFSWEKFIDTYPESNLIAKAKELYKEYQYGYLLGMDNTRVMDRETLEIYPENKVEFNRFIAKYPNSPTAKLVKIVLNHTGSMDELYALIKKEQDALGLN
ncbi:MAG: hypothetical protein V4581_06865 [Bacteroidota bacterium]